MYKRRHWDGTPLTSSEQSSVMDSNASALSRITSQMSSASVAYRNDSRVLARINSVSASHSNDPFTLNDIEFNSFLSDSAEIFESDKSNAVSQAPKLSSAYNRLSEENSAMMNGTVADELIRSENAEQVRQSSQAVKVQIQSDPQFSLSYSASVSASASFADLPQSKQTSLLNSYAENERNRKDDSLFGAGNQGQNLPTSMLNEIRNGTYNEANNSKHSKRGGKK